MSRRLAALTAATFLVSFAAILHELALTRVFGVVLFASFAHLALAIALMGIAAGALALHVWPWLVPAEGLERRLGHLAVAQAAASVVSTATVLSLPLTVQSDAPVTNYVAERLGDKWELVDPLWFGLSLPVLTLPFVCIGLLLAGLFQHRHDRIGLLYGSDLVGGALGAAAFVPLLVVVPAPDVSFLVAAACLIGAAALYAVSGARRAAVLGVLGTAVAVALTIGGAANNGLLPVSYPAGFSEDHVQWVRWTPVARMALHETGDEVRVLLDNSSSSQVITTEARLEKVAKLDARSLVFRMHDPPGRVAVLAASAGPDVAVAHHFGFVDIDAIDVVPDIGDMVLARFADAEVNAFRDGNTRRVLADARAAVLHSDAPYDIIQMMHANLHGANGLLADAWSPALLGTQEAFATYLDHLTEDGTISFARGSRTKFMVQAAAAALEARGVAEPWRHIAYVGNESHVMLVKKRPFTKAERRKLGRLLKGRQRLIVDPTAQPDDEAREALWGNPAMTDDRPYTDTPAAIAGLWREAVGRWFGRTDSRVRPEEVVYHVLAVEAVAVVAGGVLLVAVPWFSDRRRRVAPVPGGRWLLGYVACLGYGYLAIELVLIHELVLFLGHPVFALSAVVFTMLLASGIGSLLAQRVPLDRAGVVLPAVLASVVLLAGFAGIVAPDLLMQHGSGAPLGARVALAALVVGPPALVMGLPFPLAIRALPGSASGLVPRAWALNGWMSVASALSSAVLSRFVGYEAALLVGVGVYALAFLLCWRLPRARAVVDPEPRPVPAPAR